KQPHRQRHRRVEPRAECRSRQGRERAERAEHARAIRRRRDDDLGRRAEGDEADLEPAWKRRDERLQRLHRRVETRRLDVGGAHRAGDVDEQDDGTVVRRRRGGRAAAEAEDRAAAEGGVRACAGAAPLRTAPRARRPPAAGAAAPRPSPDPFRSNHDEASITSTMFRVKVDRAEPTELHEQVAAEIRRAIADGEAGPGERLPPARDLAAVLGVNANTVLRALRALRDEGLLEFRRGRGVTVAGTPQRGAVVERARELVRFARANGYRTDELVDIIRSVG